jgi:hypothetical protein
MAVNVALEANDRALQKVISHHDSMNETKQHSLRD